VIQNRVVDDQEAVVVIGMPAEDETSVLFVVLICFQRML